jgi:hypothetical protein
MFLYVPNNFDASHTRVANDKINQGDTIQTINYEFSESSKFVELSNKVRPGL